MRDNTVYGYFRRALRNAEGAMGGEAGPLVRAEDGNLAAFRLRIAGGRIAGARYRCTTCATLVALCEHLAEILGGMPVGEAERLRPDDLLGLHPEIPPARRDRAALAVRALHAALAAAR